MFLILKVMRIKNFIELGLDEKNLFVSDLTKTAITQGDQDLLI